MPRSEEASLLMTDHLKSLPADALNLVDFLHGVGDGIAALVIALAPMDCDAMVDRELAKVAQELRSEDKSLVLAIDACLRERISATLAARKT